MHTAAFPDPYYACIPGEPIELAPGVIRLVAPNPGVMTGPGTNSYIIGSDELVVVDPGPDNADHVHLLADIGEGRISKIAVTHKHLDHAPGAGLLAQLTGAEIAGFAPSPGFEPDRLVANGDILRVRGVELRAIHTPGHSSDHVCYLLAEENLLFTGDHMMQGSTVVIAPLDGDMAKYMESLRLLLDIAPLPRALLPGHGAWMDDPARIVSSVIEHRQMREETVWGTLCHMSRAGQDGGLNLDRDETQVISTRSGQHHRKGSDKGKNPNENDDRGREITIDDMLAVVYGDVSETLYPVARYSLWAHLRKLAQEGKVHAADMDDISTVWRPSGSSC
ncbi:MAG: MBL fold metallo-hydrolase [Acidimicrobiales bacterium]